MRLWSNAGLGAVCHDGRTGRTPEQSAAAAKKAIDTAEGIWKGSKSEGALFMAGYLDAEAGAGVVATSRGLFAYHRSSSVRRSNTARTPEGTGSGWASTNARE